MAQNVATVTKVAAATSAVTLFVGSTSLDRGARVVFNDSAAVLYLKYGPAATDDDWTVKIAAGGYWEAPGGIYDGLITGVWATATGSGRCTEVL